MAAVMLRLGLILACVAVAGCLGAAQPLAASEKAAPDWSSLALRQRGEAGEWVAAWVPHAPLDVMPPMEATVVLRAQPASPGEPVTAFLRLPSPLWRQDGDLVGMGMPGYRTETGAPGQALEIREELRSGATSGWQSAMEGLLLAAGASGPWTLDVEVGLGSGAGSDKAAPAWQRGSGFASTQACSEGSRGTVRAELETSAPGWNHVQARRDQAQPLAREAFQLTFASGERWGSAQATTYGAYVSDSAGTVVRHMASDFAGVWSDGPGLVTAEVRYEQAGDGQCWTIVHLPHADLEGLGIDRLGPALYAGMEPYAADPLGWAARQADLPGPESIPVLAEVTA